MLEFPGNLSHTHPHLRSALDLYMDFKIKSISLSTLKEFLTFSWDNCKTLDVPRLTMEKPAVYGTMMTRAYLYGMLAKCQALWQATVVHFLI